MKKLLPIAIALASALFVLPAEALTQQEMIARYRASAQPIPHRYHGCYRDGMLLRAEYVPSPTSGHPLAHERAPPRPRMYGTGLPVG